MKILLIASIYPTNQHPDYGTYVRNIHKLYEQSGHQVNLVAFCREGGKFNKLKNIRLFFKRINEALLKQDQFDLINVQYPYIASLPLARQLKNIRIPLLVSVHGSDVFPDRFSKLLVSSATKKLLNGCQRIIVPSEFFKQRMLRHSNLEESKFKVVSPGGYDASIFYPKQKTKLKYDQDDDITENFKTVDDTVKLNLKSIGFVGRLVEGKGWRILLEAFQILKKYPEGKDFQLKIVGSGPDKEAIEEYAKLLNISQWVTLTGPLKASELGDFYRGLDFFAFPTQFEESLGVVGIEALACGIPVIGSASGGVTAYLKDQENGLLVEPGNAEALANAMLIMIQKSPSERKRISHNAIESVKAYEQTVVCRRLDEIIMEEMS